MAFRGQNRDLYEFARFRLDATERTLTRDGVPVPLAPKVFDTLLVLVMNSGLVLEKEELLRAIWPDSFVEESNLAQNISQLRKALGEGTAEQRLIETIPKRGYRFVAEVRKVEGRVPEFAAAGRAEADLFINDDAEIEAGGEARHAPGFGAEGEIDEGVLSSEGPQPIGPSPLVALPGRERTLVVTRPRSHLPLAVLLAGLLAVAALAGYFIYKRQAASTVAFQKMRITKLTSSGKARLPAISPDGKYVAYVQDEAGKRSLWVRQVAATSSVQIVPPAEVTCKGLTFSSDGDFVYYVLEEKGQNPGLVYSTLYRVPLLGGTPDKILFDVDSPVTFSPDGRQFAFLRFFPAEKEGAVMVANADGTGERRLSVRRRPQWYSPVGPSWSPDGKYIACAVGDRGTHGSQAGVALVSVADGTEQLLGTQDLAWIGQVAWLSDSSGVAVNAWHKETAAYADQVWLLSYPGGNLSRLTNDLLSYNGLSAARAGSAIVTARSDRVMRLWVVTGGDSESAVPTGASLSDNYSEQLGLDWPTAGRLLYASHGGGNLDVWAMDADGANPKQLTLDPHTDVLPVGTPDGRYVVFVSERAGTTNIWRADADGANPKQLTTGRNEGHPSVSPDGRWVVYTSRAGDVPQLWKVSIDGGEPVKLSNKALSTPRVSPDGKLIACYHRDEQLKVHVALLPFEGGDEVKTLKMQFPAWGAMEWTPDGTSLSYIRNVEGVSNIWTQPISGGEPRQLTHFKTDQIFRFAWSPDGERLACERGTTLNDIVLISNFK
jgi:eukaryotic-like serine/threonine-protein kinase